MTHTITVRSNRHEEMIDITSEVQKIAGGSGVSDGVCFVYTPHTTAAVTINENADPSVPADILKGLSHLKLEGVSFSHMEGNSPAHIKSSLIGCSATVFVSQGRLQLGTWQGIFFCEFDGPRSRKVMVKVI
jgi:secondary thiamine-phosphate synthase enzyme